jgi:hypothetical protein
LGNGLSCHTMGAQFSIANLRSQIGSESRQR